MGLGPSKCCKPKREGEKTPLTDVERGGSGPKPVFSGRRNDGRLGTAGGDSNGGGSPIDPDPGVFYATPGSKISSRESHGPPRRRDRDNKSRGRREREDRGRVRDGADRDLQGADKDLQPSPPDGGTKHHRKSPKKVGEGTILRYHAEHPARAPLLGSSSESEYDEYGHGVGSSKTWIGVCPAKLQHRVWWWSVTFILCFILCAGMFLGLAHSFSPGNGSSPSSPAAAEVTPNVAPHAPPSTAASTAAAASYANEDASVSAAAGGDSVRDAANLAEDTDAHEDTDAVAERKAVNSVKAQVEAKTGELKHQVENLVPEPAQANRWEAEERALRDSIVTNKAAAKTHAAEKATHSALKATAAKASEVTHTHNKTGPHEGEKESKATVSKATVSKASAPKASSAHETLTKRSTRNAGTGTGTGTREHAAHASPHASVAAKTHAGEPPKAVPHASSKESQQAVPRRAGVPKVASVILR